MFDFKYLVKVNALNINKRKCGGYLSVNLRYLCIISLFRL